MRIRSKRPFSYSMTLNNWYEILVGELLPWRIHPSLKTWRRFKEQCTTLKVISCLCYLIETIWLSLMNCYIMHTWRIMRIIISSQFKMSNFLKSFKILFFLLCFRLSNGRLFGGFSWHGGSWEMWKFECVWIWTWRDPNTWCGGRVTWIVSWWRLCNF